MPYISEHDSKEEGECSYRKQPWVDLLVAWHSIGVDNLLEWGRECIQFQVGGRGPIWINGEGVNLPLG